MKNMQEIRAAFVDSKITIDGGGGPEDVIEGTLDGIMLGLWIAGFPKARRDRIRDLFNAIHSDEFQPSDKDLARFKLENKIPD